MDLHLDFHVSKFMQCASLRQEHKDFLRHMFICETKIDGGLEKREQRHAVCGAIAFHYMFEESKADLIWEDGNIILKNFNGLLHFLRQATFLPS